eukprot:gene157-biopygen6063
MGRVIRLDVNVHEFILVNDAVANSHLDQSCVRVGPRPPPRAVGKELFDHYAYVGRSIQPPQVDRGGEVFSGLWCRTTGGKSRSHSGGERRSQVWDGRRFVLRGRELDMCSLDALGRA